MDSGKEVEIVERAFTALGNAENRLSKSEYNDLYTFIGAVNNGDVSPIVYNTAKKIIDKHKNDFYQNGYTLATKIFQVNPKKLGWENPAGFYTLDHFAQGLENL